MSEYIFFPFFTKKYLCFLSLFFAVISGFCQISSNDSVAFVYNNSDFIFIGKLTGFNEYQPGKSGEKNIIADFDVVEIYKGRRWNKVMVVTNRLSLKANNEYLVYGKWGEVKNKKGKLVKTGYFNSLRIIDADKDNALPDVKTLVAILKKKMFGRIKSPRAKIVLRKCNCSTEHL